MVVIDDNYIYHSDYFVMHRNIKSLYCTPGINIMLQVNYTSKNKLQGKKKILSVVTKGEELGSVLDAGGQNVETVLLK